jgi:biopolymer transport protein ExbD
MSTGQTATQPQQGSIVRYKAALRKAKRKNAREPEIDFLNITAMLDLMTIILVFLLKSLASSSGAIPQSDDLRLPASVMTGEPAEEGLLIVVSKSQILVGEESTPVVKLPPREQLAATGVDAKYKRGGANDMYIVPLGNALEHAREINTAVRAATKSGNPDLFEAIVVVDKTTPYRLLVEVLFTLGQSGVSKSSKYHLMVMSGKK